MVEERGSIGAGGDLIYLFLPLAHAFALLIQLSAVDLGVPIAYYGGDTKAIVGELMEVRPTYLPSVPRIFEKFYTLAQQQLAPRGAGHDPDRRRPDPGPRGPRRAGARTRCASRSPSWRRRPRSSRACSAAAIREAVTGAAPIAHEILEFFWGCGIPVMEGYGMTETSTVATSSRPEAHRFGSVGKPLAGVEVKIAEDGELLIKGTNIFGGYYKNDDASFGAVEDGWLHTGDLGSIDADGYVYITGRKKDIIITAGGKNLTPANLENDLKQTRWVSQAVMHGDRRPYPVMLVTLDEEEIVPWARGPGHRGPLDRGAGRERAGPGADPGDPGRGQQQVRAGRAGQEVRDPRPRPQPGDRRADADPEGQAQRRQREVRLVVRRAVLRLSPGSVGSCERSAVARTSRST